MHLFAYKAGSVKALPTCCPQQTWPGGCFGHPPVQAMLRIGCGQHVDNARSLRFVGRIRSHTFTLQTSAWRWTRRGDANEPTRHARQPAKQQARTARRRGNAACRTLDQGAAGAAHLSKCMDALRPGDITTDYAASARWMGLATNEPRANSGVDAARNLALCR